MVTSANPVATGLVKRLAQPRGNVTGITQMTRELSGNKKPDHYLRIFG